MTPQVVLEFCSLLERASEPHAAVVPVLQLSGHAQFCIAMASWPPHYSQPDGPTDPLVVVHHSYLKFHHAFKRNCRVDKAGALHLVPLDGMQRVPGEKDVTASLTVESKKDFLRKGKTQGDAGSVQLVVAGTSVQFHEVAGPVDVMDTAALMHGPQVTLGRVANELLLYCH